jgi:transketolase
MPNHSEGSPESTSLSNKFNLSTAELKEMAKKLRRHVITMIATAGSGHPGGSLSAADIITALYFKVLRHDPRNPQWSERDRFILSKGHAAPILYAALAEAGYFPVAELATLRKLDSRLQGHADRKFTPGVTHFKLDNLTTIVDCNGIQLSGWTRDIMNLEPFIQKWQAFGWHTIDIDGHDLDQILSACQGAEKIKNKPTVIIARTIKGKGVSFMENNVAFHGKAPTWEEAERALKELE